MAVGYFWIGRTSIVILLRTEADDLKKEQHLQDAAPPVLTQTKQAIKGELVFARGENLLELLYAL